MQPNAQQPQAPQGAAQGQQGDPQTLAAYQRIVAAAARVVYDKSTSSQLVQMVKSAPDPIQGIVHATMVVLDHLKQQTSGINPNFVYTASVTVSLMIAELAEAAGVIKVDAQKMGQYKQALEQGLLQQLQQRAQQQGQTQAAQPAQQPSPVQGAAPAAQTASGA